MLAAWIVSRALDLAGSSPSRHAPPVNCVNRPRTVVKTAWRTAKPTRVAAGSTR
jgi:hypothetical protein